MTVDDYKDFKPSLDPVICFDAKLTAHGVIKTCSGLVIGAVNANINAFCRHGIGTLEDEFLFDIGAARAHFTGYHPASAGHTCFPNKEFNYDGRYLWSLAASANR